MKIKLITDSASDIELDYAKELGVTVMPIRINFGEESFLDRVTISNEEFFRRMENGEYPTTAQITPYECEHAFKEALVDNDYVICITLSSKLSGEYNAALLASTKFDGKVFVIDSNNVCVGQHILVKRTVDLINSGMDAKDVVEQIEKEKHNIKVYAFLNTLEYLKRGGRISKTTAFVGGVLSIKPLVEVKGGAVEMVGKAKGIKNAKAKLVELVEAANGINLDLPYVLGNTGDSDELMKEFAEFSKHLFKGQKQYFTKVGPTIGTHVGPGLIAIGFFENK